VKVVGSAVAKRRRRKTILPWALAAMRTASTQKNYPHFGHDHGDVPVFVEILEAVAAG